MSYVCWAFVFTCSCQNQDDDWIILMIMNSNIHAPKLDLDLDMVLCYALTAANILIWNITKWSYVICSDGRDIPTSEIACIFDNQMTCTWYMHMIILNCESKICHHWYILMISFIMCWNIYIYQSLYNHILTYPFQPLRRRWHGLGCPRCNRWCCIHSTWGCKFHWGSINRSTS